MLSPCLAITLHTLKSRSEHVQKAVPIVTPAAGGESRTLSISWVPASAHWRQLRICNHEEHEGYEDPEGIIEQDV